MLQFAPLLVTAHKLGTATLVDPTDEEEVRVFQSINQINRVKRV